MAQRTRPGKRERDAMKKAGKPWAQVAADKYKDSPNPNKRGLRGLGASQQNGPEGAAVHIAVVERDFST